MDVTIEAAAFTAGVTMVAPVVKAVVVRFRDITIPSQRAAASFPSTLSFGSTSLSAVSPDLFQNGGLYALV